MAKVLWEFEFTDDMAMWLDCDKDEIRHIISELDDAVKDIFQEYESVRKYNKNKEINNNG
jgi:hypothetical protein